MYELLRELSLTLHGGGAFYCMTLTCTDNNKCDKEKFKNDLLKIIQPERLNEKAPKGDAIV
jgi:hypothetical protein